MITVDLNQYYNSINASHQASNTSEKYKFIPTTQVVKILNNQGWLPVKACEVKSRKHEGYQKHMIRFRHVDKCSYIKIVDSVIPEIVLTNAHDASAAFNIMFGLFRLVCSNGLVVSDGVFQNYKIRHMGYKDEEVVNATLAIAKETPKIMDIVEQWKSIELTDNEQRLYSESALLLKFDENDSRIQNNKHITIGNLIRPKRTEDVKPTLWNTYNIVQEKFLKGGRYVHTVNKMREVKSINDNIKLNKALWALTEKMAELKAA